MAQEFLTKADRLKGQENFIEWLKRFQAAIDIEEWGAYENGIFTPVSEIKEKEAKRWIFNSITNEVIRATDIKKSASENLSLLNKTFGYGRVDPLAQFLFLRMVQGRVNQGSCKSCRLLSLIL